MWPAAAGAAGARDRRGRRRLSQDRPRSVGDARGGACAGERDRGAHPPRAPRDRRRARPHRAVTGFAARSETRAPLAVPGRTGDGHRGLSCAETATRVVPEEEGEIGRTGEPESAVAPTTSGERGRSVADMTTNRTALVAGAS